VTAGVLATDLDRRDGLNMLIDMGTNGEIVIGNKDWLVCASASAGPAFEGSETRDGVRTQAGAVDHVKLLNKDRFLSLSTVGGSAPIGVCGTGYIDLLAELLRHGVMDRTGRIDLLCGSRRVAGSEQHEARFVVAYPEESGTGREIAITQYDIENMLRAKAAIYAATRVLLGSLGLDISSVERIFIAGGFGNYLDMESAITIGLLPDVPVERVKFVGNGSITGAKMCMLSSENYQRARRTAARMTYFELGTDSSFMDEFLAAKFFPHTDIQKFPSVCAKLNLGR